MKISGGLVWLLGVYFGAPILLARTIVGASWIVILGAYLIWFAVLTIFGLTSGRTRDERVGWPLIFGIFFTIPVITVLVLVFRLAGVR